MRFAKLAMAVGVVALLTGVAVADSPLRQPMSVQQTAFEFDNYYNYYEPEPEKAASESPSDQPAEVAAPESCDVGCDMGACAPSGCRSKCGRCCGGVFGCCDLGEPCELRTPCGLQCLGIDIGGWVSSGMYANTHGAKTNGPLGFRNLGDGYNLDQLWFYAERAADTGGCGWDWGFRMDYVFGVDGPDTQCFGDGGWDSGWNTSDNGEYGSALPQLYGELAYNNLSVKIGHFYTIIGYEVVQAPDNFFYSHAYTMYYGEPFTHMGALATYTMNDDVTLYGGWTNGWDNGWLNPTGASTFLGGASLALTDNSSVTWAVNTGDFGNISGGNVYMNSIVFQTSLTERLTYVLQHDLGNQSGAADAEWYGINQYLLYQLNECWGVGARMEWFRDDDGARVVAGNAGSYYELTLGLNYKPHANVMIRPEIRYDGYDGDTGSGALPFNDGQSSYQWAGGFDVIVTF